MKKLKIKKRMASFLMLAVMVVSIIGVMPKTTAYADDVTGSKYKVKMYYNFTTDELKGIYDTYSFLPDTSDVDAYCAYNLSTGRYNVFFVSKNTFSVDRIKVDYKGNSSTGTSAADNCSTCFPSLDEGVMNYQCFSFEQYSVGGNFAYRYSSTFGRTLVYTDDLSEDDLIMIILGGKTNDSCYWEDGTDTGSIPDGSQDNPMEDKDIGTIVLKSHGFISTKNDNFIGDVSASYDYYFKYKDKTSSGFSISDNKYARTFIQIRVQNQCVLFEKGNENSIKEYYPHYGEFYNYKNLATENVSNNTVKVSWGEVMSKWSDYAEHPLATNKKLAYRFMLRVICTDSLTVVPDESSGWYAGGWRSFIFDGDKFLEETNGHVDGDGNWSDDEDDGYNDSSDKTSHNNENKDDVDDLLNDDSSSSGSSGKLNISNIKAFMKEVGNVPKAIGKLFSFLPDWVTTFIGFGFVVLVTLIIIKAIRG